MHAGRKKGDREPTTTGNARSSCGGNSNKTYYPHYIANITARDPEKLERSRNCTLRNPSARSSSQRCASSASLGLLGDVSTASNARSTSTEADRQ